MAACYRTGQVAELLGVDGSTLRRLVADARRAGIPCPFAGEGKLRRWWGDPRAWLNWIGRIQARRQSRSGMADGGCDGAGLQGETASDARAPVPMPRPHARGVAGGRRAGHRGDCPSGRVSIEDCGGGRVTAPPHCPEGWTAPTAAEVCGLLEGRTQAAAAAALGVTVRQVRRWQRGEAEVSWATWYTLHQWVAGGGAGSLPLSLMGLDELTALFDALPDGAAVEAPPHRFEKVSGDLWSHQEAGMCGRLDRSTGSVLGLLVDSGAPVKIVIVCDEGLSR